MTLRGARQDEIRTRASADPPRRITCLVIRKQPSRGGVASPEGGEPARSASRRISRGWCEKRGGQKSHMIGGQGERAHERRLKTRQPVKKELRANRHKKYGSKPREMNLVTKEEENGQGEIRKNSNEDVMGAKEVTDNQQKQYENSDC